MMSVQQPSQPKQSMVPHQGASINATPYHSASLYVGDLDPEINETTLFEIFNQVGPVASIRVCRDANTRRSLGYSYVNFHNMADAERALDTLNFSPIKGNPCRIMWSQRDPSMRRSGVGNIFVKNLDSSVDNKALYDTFSLFGNILSCKVVTDKKSDSKGYGYVHYETAESANEAIARINGMMIAGQQVQVDHFLRRNERATNNDWTNIYVKNIPLSWDENKLREEFGKFGEITSIKIQSETSDNGMVSKGFGFINFAEHTSASSAVDKMSGTVVEGADDNPDATEDSSRKLFCCRAQKKNERMRELKQRYESAKAERLNKSQGANLYVKNLDENVTDEVLNDMFSSYGQITSARIMKDSENGQSKGFGFVCFSKSEEAMKAVQEMNNKLISGKPIYVALAQRKEARRAQLEAQFSQGAIAPRGPLTPMQPGMYGMGMSYMMAGTPSPFQQPQQPRMATAFPTTPQMMPRGAPRASPVPSYPTPRGTYPIPNYSVGMMANQNQQARRPSSTSSTSRGRIVPTGSTAQSMQRPVESLNGNYARGPSAQNSMSQRGNAINQRGGSVYKTQSNPSQSNFKYTQQVRNHSLPQGHMGGMMMGGGSINVGMLNNSHPESLSAQTLAAASPEQQKNMLGEKLYPLIFEVQPEFAGKITGMLLEMDNGELLHLLESPEALKSKIREAIVVLEAHRIE